jgi:hypothetical protein
VPKKFDGDVFSVVDFKEFLSLSFTGRTAAVLIEKSKFNP